MRIMLKDYSAEVLVAGSTPAPLTKIHYGIVHRRPKWGSPPTVKVDLFTYRVRLRGRAEGSSTWISERHCPGRRNDSTKASCLDIQASLGALYKAVLPMERRPTMFGCIFQRCLRVRFPLRPQSIGEKGIAQGGQK